MEFKNERKYRSNAHRSTDRRQEVSIKTRIELDETFVKELNWKLLKTYSDAAVGGTSYRLLPSIDSLMAHVKLEVKRPVARAVLGDEFVKDQIGLALVKTLLHEHTNHPILKIFKPIGCALGCHAKAFYVLNESLDSL